MMEEKIQYFPNNKRNQFHMSVPNFFAIRSLCSVCCCPPLCSKTTIPTPPLPRSFDSVPALPHVDALRISYLSLTLFTSRSRQQTNELDWSTCWTTGKIKIRFDCPVCPASASCCWSNNINSTHNLTPNLIYFLRGGGGHGQVRGEEVVEQWLIDINVSSAIDYILPLVNCLPIYLERGGSKWSRSRRCRSRRRTTWRMIALVKYATMGDLSPPEREWLEREEFGSFLQPDNVKVNYHGTMPSRVISEQRTVIRTLSYWYCLPSAAAFCSWLLSMMNWAIKMKNKSVNGTLMLRNSPGSGSGCYIISFWDVWDFFSAPDSQPK